MCNKDTIIISFFCRSEIPCFSIVLNPKQKKHYVFSNLKSVSTTWLLLVLWSTSSHKQFWNCPSIFCKFEMVTKLTDWIASRYFFKHSAYDLYSSFLPLWINFKKLFEVLRYTERHAAFAYLTLKYGWFCLSMSLTVSNSINFSISSFHMKGPAISCVLRYHTSLTLAASFLTLSATSPSNPFLIHHFIWPL